MAKLFKLAVFTPEHEVFSGDVEALTVTTLDGEYTFLADHAPLVMPLVVGTLKIRTSGETLEVFNSEGFLEIDHEGASVFVQASESPEEIDKFRAEEARIRAEERLRQKQSNREYQNSKLALARAMARLKITNQKRLND
jgi:F-type H+-transporting ATPase subunit epsilon